MKASWVVGSGARAARLYFTGLGFRVRVYKGLGWGLGS